MRAIIVEAEVRCLMLSTQELTAVAAVIKDCTCVRTVVVMDRYGPKHVWTLMLPLAQVQGFF